MSKFIERVAAQKNQGRHLCVGIDPVMDDIPDGLLLKDFLLGLVIATHPYAAAFKPNIAFFERLGREGWDHYQFVIDAIRDHNPKIPIIGDWKRGDIGATNLGYIEAAFEELKVDALTLHQYLGRESVADFLQWEEKGLIFLCRTSNPGGGEFQDLIVDTSSDPVLGQNRAPLYLKVAHNISRYWNTNGNCGLVTGATYPAEIGMVRQVAPDMFLLIPGVGSQGGDEEAAIRNAYSATAVADCLVSVSGGISRAYKKSPNLSWVEATTQAAKAYSERFHEIYERVRQGG